MHLTEEFLEDNPNMCAYMAPSLDVRQDVVVVEVLSLDISSSKLLLKSKINPELQITLEQIRLSRWS